MSRRLEAPPTGIFEELADHARYHRFEGVHRSELARSGDRIPNGVGAVRRIWLGPLRFVEEITVFEPPSRMDYVIREVRRLPFRHEGGSIRLTPADGGTDALWTSTFEIPVPVIGRPLDWAFARALERGFGKMLEKSAELSGKSV